MLRDRLRSAAVLIALVAGLMWADSRYSPAGAEGVFLLPLLLLFTLGTAWDFATLLIGNNRSILRGVAMAGAVIVAMSAAVPMLWSLTDAGYPVNCPVGRLGWIVIGTIVSVFSALLVEMRAYGRGPSGAIDRSAHTIFVITYVGLPMALLVSLRMLGTQWWGLAAVVTTIAVTKASDTGAYFTGKTLGRNKLIPRLSPGKTREGAVGGIVASTLVAYLCLRFLMPATGSPTGAPSIAWLTNPVWGAIVLGPMLAIAGMVGDLAESMVKRDTGAKDSGSLLPGMGGVWDVTDSLIAAALPAFLAFASGVGW